MAKSQSEFRDLLHRYQRGECTPAEKQRLAAWYRQLGPDQGLNLTPAEKQELVATVWQRISDQTAAARASASRTPASNSQPSWPTSLRWAAAAALVLSTGILSVQLGYAPLQWSHLVLQTPTASPETTPKKWRVYTNSSAYGTHIALPDGSAVTLAPASTLKYSLALQGSRRVVYLRGQAFFDVFHDKQHPFLVFTDKVVTSVLGTSFDVEAYANSPEVQVRVRTGAVRVSAREAGTGSTAASVVVMPNQQAVYSPTRHHMRRDLVAQPALLAPQSFVFADRPVAEVLTTLSKAYQVDIVYDAAALRSCTLNLTLGNEPLFEKLNIICETLGATYEKADGRILFHSRPCQAE
jgi:ferric-dicitrate binding protein FerR (iron transport regulator)